MSTYQTGTASSGTPVAEAMAQRSVRLSMMRYAHSESFASALMSAAVPAETATASRDREYVESNISHGVDWRNRVPNAPSDARSLGTMESNGASSLIWECVMARLLPPAGDVRSRADLRQNSGPPLGTKPYPRCAHSPPLLRFPCSRTAPADGERLIWECVMARLLPPAVWATTTTTWNQKGLLRTTGEGPLLCPRS